MLRSHAHRMSGLSLIELMISLVISSVLIAGAVLVYSQSRTTYSTNEAAARLQEEARYVFSVMEPDLQLAGYFGYSNAPQDFSFWNAGTVTPVSQLQQLAGDTALASLPASATKCGKNFAVDLLATVEGSDNAMTLPAACRAAGVVYRPATDVLTIRRADVNDAPAASSGKIQLLVNRMKRTNQRIFISSASPETLDPDVNALRDLIVRTYYVANGAGNLPTLRVVALRDGATPTFEDTELMPGIEDLQVQFGLDTGDYDGNGTIDPDQDQNGDGLPDSPNGIATRYIDPSRASVAAFAGLQVVSVRVWLLVRAERPEIGFANIEKYEYAGKVYEPKDNIRRTLVSRTIQLRNARTL